MSVWSDIAYDVADVVDFFGTQTVRRAASYRDKISGVRDKQWPITARVKGTELYATSLDLDDDDELISRCTCPVETRCKHAAALALRLSADDGTSAAEVERPSLARPEGELGRWLELVEPAGEPAPREKRFAEVLYFLTEDRGQIVLEIRRAKVLRDGRFGKPKPLRDPRTELYRRPDEVRLVERLAAFRRYGPTNYGAYSIADYNAQLMSDLIDTGRLFWQGSRTPIGHGESRSELPVWVQTGEVVRLEFPSGHRVLPTQDSLYLDSHRNVIGPLDLAISARQRQMLAETPALAASLVPGLQRGMARIFGRPLEIIGDVVTTDTSSVEGEPLSCEVTLHLFPNRRWRPPEVRCEAIARYGDRAFELCRFEDSDPVGRDILAETRRRKQLEALIASIPTGYFDDDDSDRMRLINRDVADRVVPRLRSSGWLADLGEGFTATPPIADVRFVEELAELDVHDGPGSAWFSYSLGVEVEGETHSLLPILVEALRDPKIELNLAELARGGGDGITVEVGGGKRIYIPKARLVKWLRPLLELELRGLSAGELRLAAPLALELASAEGDDPSFAAIATRLRDQLSGLLDLTPAAAPAGFIGELRDYQKRGLSWLAFLHDRGFGGILADDMGLGKTIQLLALAQRLKVEGKLPAGSPVLVVAPRSVCENWQREIARFTPSLESRVHLGASRAKDPAAIRADVDVVITSYQTLLRDIEVMRAIEWTTLVLDEAQAIKNPKTKLRRAIETLKAISRVCVTGTPIENRLLELWSQIDVAMPGLCGSKTGFVRVFESPIKNGDVRALEALKRRLKPFMLRRTKADVELSLPPKTETIMRVDIVGGQRDLYEGLRLVLAKSVRDALADRGVGGSAMIVLDALLKLRQSCCDPRLVKVESARSVTESAKLERLMRMLEELAGSGRKVLVFSQFATMLGLIEEACAEAGIATAKLTGQTRKRQQVIDSFQAGDVPVFLVSLKAGGVGLNLTAADTVIHYDPWWNPAAEAQATDRAHRIGQTKPVFVYKLIAARTVEEKVLELQEQKRSLTEAGLSKAGVSHLSASDLVALFDGVEL